MLQFGSTSASGEVTSAVDIIVAVVVVAIFHHLVLRSPVVLLA